MSIKYLELLKKMNMLFVILLASILSLRQHAIALTNVHEQFCIDRYEKHHPYYMICRQHKSSNVFIFTGDNPNDLDINNIIDDKPEDSLMILPSNSYYLNKPLKMKKGQGIIPETHDGFINLMPSTDGYAIEKNLFTVLEIGENGKHGGIKINAEDFKETTAFKSAKYKTLIYSSMVQIFELTMMNLTGCSGIDNVIWGDNSKAMEDSHSKIMHSLSHSYIEGYGAKTTIKLELPFVDSEDNIPLAHINHSIITVGGNNDHKIDKQTALYIVNGPVIITNGHLAFRKSTATHKNTGGTTTRNKRHLLYLEDSDKTIVENMVFYSEEEMMNHSDLVFNMARKKLSHMQTTIMSNIVTKKAKKIMTDDHVKMLLTKNNNRWQIIASDNYIFHELAGLPLPHVFFLHNASAGNQLVDRYTLRNIGKINNTMSSDISVYYQDKLEQIINSSPSAISHSDTDKPSNDSKQSYEGDYYGLISVSAELIFLLGVLFIKHIIAKHSDNVKLMKHNYAQNSPLCQDSCHP